jgi:hypothetical protein
MSDWNKAIIEEFRTNDGKVGGNFEGAPLLLLPGFADYEAKTSRQIPVVILEPV